MNNNNIKHYAPTWESIVPALMRGKEIKIPFQLNRLTSAETIYGYKLIVKSVNTGLQIAELNTWDLCNALKPTSEFLSYWFIDFDDKGGGVIKIPSQFLSGYYLNDFYDSLQQNTFYKLQLCFLNDQGQEGYYSSVAISKNCIYEHPGGNVDFYEPAGIYLTANNDNNTINYFSNLTLSFGYTSFDISERVDSYQVELYNSEKMIFQSEELIYNSINDIFGYDSHGHPYISSKLLFEVPSHINRTQLFQIKMKVKTNNLLFLEITDTFDVENTNQFVKPTFQTIPQPLQDNENGLIYFNQAFNDQGFFFLSRSDNLSNYSTWIPLAKFQSSFTNNIFTFKDKTVVAGVIYKYALQQWNPNNLNIVSERVESDPIEIISEHLFLLDANRQLKINFNPKVSSFKNTILETKTDTIGSRTPYFFRNGHVNYKEIPISGLISYLSDEQHLFATFGSEDEEIVFNKNAENVFEGEWLPTTNLTAANVAVELQFKTKVLEWLTNGEPKILKSPYEGNYIVRLMNVSLTPQDTLGRMLHTFQATAYEIGEYSYDNLKQMNLTDTSSLENFKVIPVEKTLQYYPQKTNETQILSFGENGKYIKQIIFYNSFNSNWTVDGEPIIVNQNVLTIPVNKTVKEITHNFISNNLVDEPYVFVIYEDQMSDSNSFENIQEVKKIEVVLEQYFGTEKSLVISNGLPQSYYNLSLQENNNINREKIIFLRISKQYLAENLITDTSYTYITENGRFQMVDDTFTIIDLNGINISTLSIGNGLLAEISYSFYIESKSSQEGEN